MWSVPSRRSDPSTAAFTFAALLSMTPGPPPRVGDEPELGGDLHLVAAALDGLADDFFAVEGAVDLGGVDVGDAEVEGAVDGADRLVVVETAAGRVGAGHGHGAEPDAGDLRPPRCAFFMLPPSAWCGDQASKESDADSSRFASIWPWMVARFCSIAGHGVGAGDEAQREALRVGEA